MSLSVIKGNKCFVPALTVKFSGTDSVTIPANASGSRSILFSDSNITINDCAIVTVQADAATLSALQNGTITINHAIANGAVSVNVFNTDSAEHTVTVNVIVL